MIAWNKLYKKSLFESICYPEGTLYEDTATTYKLIWKANRIICVDKVLYYYYRHPNSITLRKKTRKSKNDQFLACWQQCSDLLAWGYNSAAFECYMTNVAFDYCMKNRSDFSDVNYVEASKFLNNLTYIPHFFTLKQKLLIILFWLSPKLFSTICWFCGKQII